MERWIEGQTTDLFAAAFAASPDMMTISTLDTGVFLAVNEAFVAQSGYSAAEALGKTSEELELWTAPELRRSLREKLEREGQVREFEVAFKVKGGERRLFQLSAAVTQHEGRDCILSILRDVTESARLLEELGKANFLLERAEEMAKIGSWEFDYATKSVSGSEGAHRIYGVPRGQMSVAAMEAVPLPEFRPLMNRARDEHIVQGKPYDIEFKIRRQSDGAILDIHSKALWDGAKNRLFGIIRDVTEEKRIEAGFQKAIAERDTLIHELNHRTNNTLQLILSLLELEEIRGSTADVDRVLKRLARRLGAISLIHENFYCSQDIDRIELQDFVLSLAARLLGQPEAGARPRLEYALNDVSIALDAALPCGLVIEELLDNALRHAYPPAEPGPIRVGASRAADGTVEIFVEDEGRGVGPDFDLRRAANSGLALARSLGEEQLRGELGFSRGSGCRCTLRFRDEFSSAQRQQDRAPRTDRELC